MKNNSSVPSLRLPELLVFCMILCAVALPHSAEAQDWKFEPIVRVGGEYDDNARLDVRTDQEVDITGYLLDLSADIEYSSPTTAFFLQPSALVRNYSDSVFDAEDYYVRSDFSRQGQLNTIGFRSRFDHESVRTAERSNVDLAVDDPDEIIDDSTGRVILSGTRDRLRMTPYWNYRLSSTSLIDVRLDYFDVGYDDVLAGQLVDYSDTRLNLNYRRRFSDVNTGLLTVTARRYDADNALGDITGYGVMAGFDYALSQKTRLRAMVGFEDAEQTGFQYDPEPVALLTLNRNLQTIRMFAQYRRSVSGGGGGRVSVVDSFTLNFERRLSERVGAGLGVRAYQVTGGGGLSIDERDYVQLQSSFQWYLSRSFVLEADYRYTVDDVSGIGGTGRANSNQINLWLVYQPKTVPK